jgi:hypothetical protein
LSKGHQISMLPTSSKHRKTHGTQHYWYFRVNIVFTW